MSALFIKCIMLNKHSEKFKLSKKSATNVALYFTVVNKELNNYRFFLLCFSVVIGLNKVTRQASE